MRHMPNAAIRRNGAPEIALVRDSVSLLDYTSERLRRLCLGAGFEEEIDRVLRVYRDLVSPWAERALNQRTSWISDISDDNTPIEFSVTLADGGSEVRVLFEPQAAEPTLEAFRAAGLAFNERLEREYGVSLTRFRAVEGVFLPEALRGSFAVWSSAVFARGREPQFKAYFNPQANGPEDAPALVEEGLAKLGLRDAWPDLRRVVMRRGPALDELKYFALDLDSHSEARVKIYVRHHDATARDLETAASAAQSYSEGETLDFVRSMRGGDEALSVRAPFTCSSFTTSGAVRPAATTVYVPVCAYSHDDDVAYRRVRDYMGRQRFDVSLYDRIVYAYTNRPLSAGVGMQAWTAIRRYGASTRLTVYLATEATRVHPPGSVPAPTRPPS